MANTAFLFPGQGSQSAGMFEPFYRAFPAVETAFDEIADPQLRRLLFEATDDELRETANAQQTVFATSFAVSQAVQELLDISPDIVAGHSLGHFTAAAEAGLLAASDGLSLVRRRGELMAAAEDEAGPGTMYAILFVDTDTVASILTAYPEVTLGGINSPQQTVISGATDAVEQAAAEIQDTAGGRCVELDVHSGFHSPVMEPAVAPFADTLAEVPFETATVPIVSDCGGGRYRSGQRAEELFREQLTDPVDWVSVVERLEAENVERAVVLPPAEEIAKITDRTTDEIEILSLDSPAELTQRKLQPTDER